MNEISKALIERAKNNFLRFRIPGLLAAAVSGSVSNGIADNNSDIDTLLFFKEKFTPEFFEKTVSEAKETGGDLYLGNPEDGFAVYYYIDKIRCDFAFIPSENTEELFNDALQKLDTDPNIHLVVNGIINSIPLFGKDWLDKYIKMALPLPHELCVKMVNDYLKFQPKWEMEIMAVERGDILFYYESLLKSVKNLIGILCGLNGMYHPGKLKGVEFTINKMKIKPKEFIRRYKNLFDINKYEATEELYKLINEILTIIDIHIPEVSTEGTKAMIKIVLRK